MPRFVACRGCAAAARCEPLSFFAEELTTMPRTILATMMLVAAVLLGPAAAPKNPNTSAEVVFADQSGSGTPYRVRSDEGVVEDPTDGAYADTVACVQAWYASKGNFFMRTVTSASPCSPPGGETVAFRALVVDLSDRVWPGPCSEPYVIYQNSVPLDLCGSNDIADARLVADRLFSASATRLDIPFSLSPNFNTTAFELTFVETLAVSSSSAGRTMTAGPDALAELYAISGRTKTLLGRYTMPLHATVRARTP